MHQRIKILNSFSIDLILNRQLACKKKKHKLKTKKETTLEKKEMRDGNNHSDNKKDSRKTPEKRKNI